MTKTLNNSKKSTEKKAEDLIIRHFLSDLLRTKLNKQSENNYNYNSINDITNSIAGLILNSIINAIVKHIIKKSSSGHKYSKCRRSKYNSQNCF